MNRRKIRRHRSMKKNSGMKFLGIIGIMIIAVICGYLTARFIIAPLLGYDTEVLKLDLPSRFFAGLQEETEPDDDKDKEEQEENQGGYALQFGLFSTEEKANALISKLAEEGISAKVKEVDEKYKVLGKTFATKEEAVEALKTIQSDAVSDVFITAI